MKYLLTLFLIAGCASLKSRQPATLGTAPHLDSTPLPWTDMSHDDDSHLLVDTQVPDEEISKSTGGDPDKEEGVEESYSPRPFLKKVKTKRVKFWIDYFTSKQRDRFQRFINNGMKYKPIIDKILDSEGLPRELFFVGLIESGYYLGAHSKASAVGPWQFIRGTGHRYGLVMNQDMDERRDIFKATLAAAQYFKDLNNIFSSWELALAAYNAGEYGIIRRIQRYKTRDYYELSRQQKIPSETINYVPKVLAAMYVYENAQKYGFAIPQNTHEFWEKTKTVSVSKGMGLDVLSRKLNLSAEVLVQLNPELKGKRTPRSYPGPYEIRVPSGKTTEWMETYVAEAPQENPRIKEIEVLRDKVENPQNYPMPKMAERAQVHVVKRGENLSLIARKHRMSVGKLAQLNRMSWRSHVRVGQRLKLDREPMATVARVAVIRTPATVEVHKVKRGETLSLIARRYDMTLKEIALLNKMTVRSQVRVGQLLRLKAASSTVVKTDKMVKSLKRTEAPIVYKLGSGETLTDVARWFGTDVASLKRHNKISQGRALQVGKSIQIPETKKGIYQVQHGDYLIKIAQKFNLNQVALMKLNKLKSGKVYPGQRLVVNLE